MSQEDNERIEELEMDIECSICCEPLDQPTVVADCGHEYCKACIEQVQLTSPNCPLCRSEIRALIKVPKLDLIIENYLYLLEREKLANKRIQAIETLKDSIQNLGIQKDNKAIGMEDVEMLIKVATNAIDKSTKETALTEKESLEETKSKEESSNLAKSEEDSEDESEDLNGRRRFRCWKNRKSREGNDAQRFNNRRRRMREEYYKNQGDGEYRPRRRYQRRHFEDNENNEEDKDLDQNHSHSYSGHRGSRRSSRGRRGSGRGCRRGHRGDHRGDHRGGHRGEHRGGHRGDYRGDYKGDHNDQRENEDDYHQRKRQKREFRRGKYIGDAEMEDSSEKTQMAENPEIGETGENSGYRGGYRKPHRGRRGDGYRRRGGEEGDGDGYRGKPRRYNKKYDKYDKEERHHKDHRDNKDI